MGLEPMRNNPNGLASRHLRPTQSPSKTRVGYYYLLQAQVHLRLPCYDLRPVSLHSFGMPILENFMIHGVFHVTL